MTYDPYYLGPPLFHSIPGLRYTKMHHSQIPQMQYRQPQLRVLRVQRVGSLWRQAFIKVGSENANIFSTPQVPIRMPVFFHLLDGRLEACRPLSQGTRFPEPGLVPPSELGISCCPQLPAILAENPATSLWNLATLIGNNGNFRFILLPLSLLKMFSSV